MKRFHLSPDADFDLDEITLYLRTIPRGPARKTTLEIRAALRLIADSPYIGMAHSDLTLIAGQEVRSRLSGTYRIYYRLGQKIPEVFAIRHTSRDSSRVLANRLH